MEKIINLINGKIRTDNKINQITDNILNNESVVLEKKKKNKKQKTKLVCFAPAPRFSQFTLFFFFCKLFLKLNLDRDLKNH